MQPQSNILSSHSNCPAVANTYDILLSNMSTAENLWLCNVQSIVQEASLKTRWVAKARQIVGEHLQCHFCDQYRNFQKLPVQSIISHHWDLMINELIMHWGKIWQNLRLATTVRNLHDPGHSAKSAGGRLQLNTHTPYVRGFAWSDTVHGCMVYTERAETDSLWQQILVAPAMPAL